MSIINRTVRGLAKVLPLCLFTLLPLNAVAQTDDALPADTLPTDTAIAATLQPEPFVVADSVKLENLERDWSTWRPDPKRSLWLALVLPGAGQIYNRKYWKLPIIYGGFVGCVYALTWNDMMYKDYSQAYLDIMDDDPGTASYNKFLHLGQQITSSNESRYKEIFKNRKDKYRRWRDLSFFCLIGVYAISVIDAYVDAELSEFDISDDLSLRIEPAVINHSNGAPLSSSSAVGVHCSFSF